MIRNYFKIALRTFWKNKVFTAITLFGLSVGITCFILLYLFVRHEWSFDSFHANKDTLYRITMPWKLVGQYEDIVEDNPLLDPDLYPILRDENPNIKHITRFHGARTWMMLELNQKRIRLGCVDEAFPMMFDFPLIAGDPNTALVHPDSIILTRKTADYFFEEHQDDYSDVVGKRISLPATRRKEYQVRGVIQDLPDNTVFEFEALVPYENSRGLSVNNNGFGRCDMLLQVKDPKEISTLEANIEKTFNSFYKSQIKSMRDMGYLTLEENPIGCRLSPFHEAYLDPYAWNSYFREGDVWQSYIMGALATLILIIACVNAVTIQLGQIVVRSLEVGIRKVVGASREQLISQFMVEAGVLCGLAIFLALGFSELLLPGFNHLSGKSLNLASFGGGGIVVFLVLSLLFITLMTGGFPSIFMSRFSPLAILRFQNPTKGRGLFTSSLVVLQFAITIVLFFCTFVMRKQIDYVNQLGVGYNREGVLVLRFPGDMSGDRADLITDRIRGLSDVKNASHSDRSFNSGASTEVFDNSAGENIEVRMIRIDPYYLDTLNIPLLSGQNFSADSVSSQNNKLLVNETFAKRFMWDDPVGQTISSRWRGKGTIIGMVKDFHIDSMKREMSPLILHMDSGRRHFLFIRYRENSVVSCREEIESIWKEIEPNRDIDLRFLDSILQQQYEQDERLNQIIEYASFIAILLSCMGLWGITAISVARRTKEIGVRKVLGAEVSGIWYLFCHDLAKLFCISLIIAIPLGWETMRRWLDQFAYHIQIPWWIFIEAGLFCIVIALATVSWLVIRASLDNPIKSLRYE